MLFTFILNFQGGIYVSQYEAASWEVAPMAWAEEIGADGIPGIGESEARAVLAGLEGAFPERRPVQLEGTKSVWCYSTLIHDELALITHVQTAER